MGGRRNGKLLWLAVAVVFFMVAKAQAQAFPFRAVKVGDPLPSVTLESLSGKKIQLKSLKGVAVILFWGADSAIKKRHSVTMLKVFEELSGKWKGKVTFLAVNAQGDSPEVIQEVIKEAGYRGEVWLDPDQEAYKAFGVFVMPSVALAKDGIIKAGYGYTHNLGELVEAQILVLLGLKTEKQVEEMLHPKEKEMPPQQKEAIRYYNLGKSMMKQGMLDQAEAAFKKAIEAYKGMPQPYVALARLYLSQGKVEDARGYLSKALALDPNSFEAALVKVKILASEGKVDEAIKKMMPLLLSHPSSYDAYVTMGDLWAKKGNWEKAAKYYKKALELCEKGSEGP